MKNEVEMHVEKH
uniref:Uncharacterized protein n=1 Tax=Oryza glumipatula TaxID=40148 RepID=A0A0E0AVG4_9ORYZ